MTNVPPLSSQSLGNWFLFSIQAAGVAFLKHSTMSSAYNLPRQAAFKITTIDGKRCIAVPRVTQRTQAPSTTTHKESKPTNVQSPIRQTEDRNSPAVSTTIYDPHPANTDASDNTSDPNSRTISSFGSMSTPEAISDFSKWYRSPSSHLHAHQVLQQSQVPDKIILLQDRHCQKLMTR